jgi:hypothetical protein
MEFLGLKRAGRRVWSVGGETAGTGSDARVALGAMGRPFRVAARIFCIARAIWPNPDVS